MVSYKVFEAFVRDLIWRDKVVRLFGSEWDAEGQNLIEVIWDDVHATWGELGGDFIYDFVAYKSGWGSEPFIKTDDGTFYVRNFDDLYELLNEYFCGEGEGTNG